MIPSPGTILMLLSLLAIAGFGGVLWQRYNAWREREEFARLEQNLLNALEENRSERARTRIAQEIHDELGRELTKINMLVTEVQRSRAEPHYHDPLDRVASLSREMHSKLNDIVWAVDPEHDGVKELVEHASRCTDRILQNAPVRVQKNFIHRGPDLPLDPGIKRNIFLLLKEAVANSIEYADARHMQVSLETDRDRFSIHVADDGIGFEPADSITKGNGLRMMKARCEELGAEFQLFAGTGKGCSIRVSGPLRRPDRGMIKK